MGIERVDPNELDRQRSLTLALWSALKHHGRKGFSGRIECCFFATSHENVEALLPGFPNWEREIAACDAPQRWSVRLMSPRIHVSRSALLELVEVVMIAANDSSCTFDGFEIDTTSLEKRPWWKIW